MSDKRRRGLLAALTADPWRKLLAITLAVVSWFFVDSRITRTIVRTVPLVFVGSQTGAGAAIDRLAFALPTDRVVGLRFLDGDRPIDSVEVAITGPRYRVTEIENGPLDLQVTKFRTLDWSTRKDLEFTAEDLGGDPLLRRELRIALTPPRIRVEVESVAEQRFPLSTATVDIVPGAFENRLQYDSAEFAPDTAVVRGPAVALEPLTKRAGKPFRAVMGAASNDRQVRGQVELVDAPGLVLEPTVLTMQLRPLTTKIDLELPIVVDDLALPPELRGAYQPETATRTVAVLAAGELRAHLGTLRDSSVKGSLEQFVAENMRLVVHVPRQPAGTTPGETIECSARVRVHGQLADQVEPNECLLGETVRVKLKRSP